MVNCNICKKEGNPSKNYADTRGLATHCRRVHKTSFIEYKKQYPLTELNSEPDPIQEPKTFDIVQTHNPASLDTQDLQAQIVDLKQSVNMLTSNLPTLQARNVETETFKTETGAVIRQIALNPKVLLFFGDAKERGFEGDLSSFINSTISAYYKKLGMQIALSQVKPL